jgi:zinc finger protein
MTEDAQPEIVTGQPCTFCGQNALTLMQQKKEVPYFGEIFVFSMTCENCKYHKSDLETIEPRDPAKYTLEVSSEADLSIRIVKSANATVKIPHMTTIEPGPAANGYVTNVEGILKRVKHAIETARDSSEDESDVTKAKNLLKKLGRVMWGQETIKIIIEDPTGNSAIISDKAVVEKLKVKTREEKDEEFPEEEA